MPKRLDDERITEIARYAANHTWDQTAKACSCSLATVHRAVFRARAGEFGDELMAALSKPRPGQPPKRSKKKAAQRKTASKAGPSPSRGSDLDAMVELMLDKAKHHEALAKRLRAAAAALRGDLE